MSIKRTQVSKVCQQHTDSQENQFAAALKPRRREKLAQTKVNLITRLNVFLFLQGQHFRIQQDLLQCPEHFQAQGGDSSEHVR